MQREHWKDLMEIIGGAVIIASLIFVGMETRNSAPQSMRVNCARSWRH